MKISTKGRYGLRALMDISIHSGSDHVALASVAERQGISVQYLEQVFSALRKGGILKSVKGPKGGYSLAVNADELSVAEVLRVLEGELTITGNLYEPGHEPTDPAEKAIKNILWEPLDRLMLTHLKNVTVADLVKEAQRQSDARLGMFYI